MYQDLYQVVKWEQHDILHHVVVYSTGSKCRFSEVWVYEADCVNAGTTTSTCDGAFTCIMSSAVKKSGLLKHHCNRSYVTVEEGVVGFSSTFHKISNFLPPVKLSVKHGLQGTHTLLLYYASILIITHWNTHFTPQRKYLYVQHLITLLKMSLAQSFSSNSDLPSSLSSCAERWSPPSQRRCRSPDLCGSATENHQPASLWGKRKRNESDAELVKHLRVRELSCQSASVNSRKERNECEDVRSAAEPGQSKKCDSWTQSEPFQRIAKRCDVKWKMWFTSKTKLRGLSLFCSKG